MVAQFTMGVTKIQSNLHVQWKIIKPSPQKVVAIAFERWSFTRVSSNMAFTGKILLFWIYGLGEVIANERWLHMEDRLYFMPATVQRTKNSIKRYWRLVIENSDSAQVVPDVHQVDYCRLPVLDLYTASYP